MAFWLDNKKARQAARELIHLATAPDNDMSGPSHWLACAHMLRGDIAKGLVAHGRFNPAETVCFFFKAGTPSAGLGANRSNRKIGGVDKILDLQVLKAHVEARRFAKY